MTVKLDNLTKTSEVPKEWSGICEYAMNGKCIVAKSKKPEAYEIFKKNCIGGKCGLKEALDTYIRN